MRGDIPSRARPTREQARKHLFQTTMSTRAYPILAPIMVPRRSPIIRGRRVSNKWCEVTSWFWILSYVLRSAICRHSILLSRFLFWSLYRLPKCTSRDEPGGNRSPTVTQLPPGTCPSKMLKKHGSTATETALPPDPLNSLSSQKKLRLA